MFLYFKKILFVFLYKKMKVVLYIFSRKMSSNTYFNYFQTYKKYFQQFLIVNRPHFFVIYPGKIFLTLKKLSVKQILPRFFNYFQKFTHS